MKHTTKRISALLLALTLLLTVMSGCGSTTPAAAGATAAPTAAAAEVPAAEDPAAAPADAPVIEGLTFTEESPLKYATVFRLFRYEGGYTLIRIDNGGDSSSCRRARRYRRRWTAPSRCCSSRWTRSILRLPPPCRSSPP